MAVFLATAAFGIVGCKQVSPGDLDRWTRDPKGESTGSRDGISSKSDEERLADATAEISSDKNFFVNLYRKDFSIKLSELTASGSVTSDKIPYSGYWYPQRLGGTNARIRQGDAPPLDKYDRAFNGGQSKAADWEREKHTVSANDPSASWAGHCNGYSASAQRHARPKHAVTKNGVTFEIHDIKALLAEIHMSAKYLFLGGRRCESQGTIPRPTGRPDPAVMGECEDINPGTFHVAVANWIGKMKHTLVFDISTGYQVWNYPLYSYSAQITEITKEDAMRRVSGSSSSTYRFNPKAEKFSYVVMTVTHAEALGYEPVGDTGPISQPKPQTYTYVLEMNAAGEIIGGEWVGASQNEHPDFLWVAFEPVVGNGSNYFGNPNVDPAQVIRLWAESIDADPNNPPLDIQEPVSLSNWAKFANFEVTLDGSQTGASFTGKKVRFAITRRNELAGTVTLEVTLDGGTPTKTQFEGDSQIIQDFDLQPGLHRMDLVWKKNGTTIEQDSLTFHTSP